MIFMFMYYLGLFLICWLSVGFLMGLKLIYFDKKFTEEHFNKKKKEKGWSDNDEQLALLTKSKYTFLAVCTLTGFIPLYGDIIGTFKNKN